MSHSVYPVIHLNDDAVLYPHIVTTVSINREESIRAYEWSQQHSDSETLLFVPQLNENDPLDINPVGVTAKIIFVNQEEERLRIMVRGLQRVKIKRVYQEEDLTFAEVSKLRERKLEHPEEWKPLLLSVLQEYLQENEDVHKEPRAFLEQLQDNAELEHMMNMVILFIHSQREQRLSYLNENNINKRFEMLLLFIEQEILKERLKKQVRQRVREQMDKNQHEYFLNEQMKAVQRELNEINPENDELEALQQRIDAAGMPEAALKKAQAELNRLRMMPSHSSEASVSRIYLDWLCDYPWQESSPLKHDLQHAAKILDEDHYGLQEIKERILEYLAVLKRNPQGKAPILCFVGPPGVGKTSLGQSIAKATGRAFERIALGGMHDEAEIRGHRRTYIGSQPGKIVQRLCKLKSNNPLILLDEIDKIGHDHRGDPADALLEVLDPAQNHQFSDHYLETDVDLSKVLFIATANTLDIPAPLLDRMEVIRLAGYTRQEKEEIAKRFIVPRQRKHHALNGKEWKIDADVIRTVIEDYTREAGVRHLEREINKMARKSVCQLERGQKSVRISRKNIVDFLGVAKYQRNSEDLNPKQGVITGLAWTSVGGELLYIEALHFKGKGKLNYTGQLGDVMQESVQTAYSVVRRYMQQQHLNMDFEQLDLHLHLPEGAVPKDGPSAGIALASVILSTLCALRVRGDVAMTGEISLQGRVLPIGGLKEKLLAAVRGQIKTVLIPADNQKDLQDMPDEVLQNLEIVPVRQIEEVFARVFADPLPGTQSPPQNPKKAPRSRKS